MQADTPLCLGHALEAQDVQVLRAAAAWYRAGRRAWLATVVETYGSAPRPVGSMAVLNDLGQVIGSVSGGCVEDDLANWLLRDAAAAEACRMLVYGRDAEERSRLRLPCNGHLRIWLEPVSEALAGELWNAVDDGIVMCRTLDLTRGAWSCAPAEPGAMTTLEGDRFQQVVGPTSRLILIGASDVSRCLAPIAISLGFKVSVVDPREEYMATWPHPACELVRDMPDDAIVARRPDAKTAVVALSHDPKLDDMALLEALKSPAFYVGAMGSARTTQARKQRLTMFDLVSDDIAKLRGPVGMDIGARTPAEIAVSIAADLVRLTRGGLPAEGTQLARRFKRASP
jgi:xanthine dehydrogenase accessory factor